MASLEQELSEAEIGGQGHGEVSDTLPTLDNLDIRDPGAEGPKIREKRRLRRGSSAMKRFMLPHSQCKQKLQRRLSCKDRRQQLPHTENVGRTRPEKETRTVPAFRGLVPRLPLIDYSHFMSTANVTNPGRRMFQTYSTMEVMAKSLPADPHEGPVSFTPLHVIQDIVYQDTMDILQSMESKLTQIDADSLDESYLQVHVDEWRRVLKVFETELRHMEASLRTFALFQSRIQGSESRLDTQGRDNIPHSDLSCRCAPQILSIQKRTQSLSNSLMINMSLVESKRGIAETESVTKLTELAFFFIPLTFSASVFSMQVKEINADRLTLAAFFILAVVITTCSYT